MRQLLIFLIAANILFFAVHYFFKPYGETEIPLTQKDIPALEILRETPGAQYTAGKSDGLSSCFTIGPYFSEKSAQLVAGKIRNFGLAVTIRSMISKETLNYLVYIPAQPDRQTAQKIAQDLWNHNVDHSKIVNSGPYKNTITFGFFQNIDKARRKTEYIRYLGYDAKYTGQKVNKKVFWVDYDEPLGTGAPALNWSHSIAPESDVQIIPRSCDEAAWYSNGAFRISGE